MAGKRETVFTDEDVGVRNGGRHSSFSLGNYTIGNCNMS